MMESQQDRDERLYYVGMLLKQTRSIKKGSGQLADTSAVPVILTFSSGGRANTGR